MNVSDLLMTIEAKIGLMECQREEGCRRVVRSEIDAHLDEIREILGLAGEAVSTTSVTDLGQDQPLLPYPGRYQRTSLAVQRAYQVLRKRGYECYADLLCCQTCALSVIDGDKYVYWHAQDTEVAVRGEGLTLAWGGDGGEIVDVLRAAGLDVEWNGEHDRRFVVRLRHEKDQGVAA